MGKEAEIAKLNSQRNEAATRWLNANNSQQRSAALVSFTQASRDLVRLTRDVTYWNSSIDQIAPNVVFASPIPIASGNGNISGTNTSIGVKSLGFDMRAERRAGELYVSSPGAVQSSFGPSWFGDFAFAIGSPVVSGIARFSAAKTYIDAVVVPQILSGVTSVHFDGYSTGANETLYAVGYLKQRLVQLGLNANVTATYWAPFFKSETIRRMRTDGLSVTDAAGVVVLREGDNITDLAIARDPLVANALRGTAIVLPDIVRITYKQAGNALFANITTDSLESHGIALLAKDKIDLGPDDRDKVLLIAAGSDSPRLISREQLREELLSADPSIQIMRKVKGLFVGRTDVSDGLRGRLSGGLTGKEPEGSYDDSAATDPVAAIKEFGISVQRGQTLGLLVGSSLGRAIGGSNQIASLVGSSVLGAIGSRFGEALWMGVKMGEVASQVRAATIDTLTLSNLNLGVALSQAAIGSVSSFLAAEMGEALGLDGLPGQVFGNVAGSMLELGIKNVVAGRNVFDGISAASVAGDKSGFFKGGFESGIANAIGSSIASFLAVKLGSMIVQPQTQAAVVLSSVGSAAGGWAFGTAASGLGWGSGAGSWVAGKLGGSSLANWIGSSIIAPGIGILIGFVLGALIGNLFGRRKPRVPTADAAVELQAPSALYALGAVNHANGGNIDLVKSMGTSARDTLNGLIAQVTGGDETAKVSNVGALPNQTYGHTGGQLWVQFDANLNGGVNSSYFDAATNPGGERFKINSADEAVDRGVLWAIPRTEIIGGDLFLKRALHNLSSTDPTRPKAPNLAALAGDLQIAEDYAFYLQNRAIIDAAIAEPYTSMKLATVDFLAFVRADAGRLNAYKAAYPAGATNADADAKNWAQIRAWGQTQWDALTQAQRDTFLQQNSAWSIAANADTAFYDANKAFMTRAMAAGGTEKSATNTIGLDNTTASNAQRSNGQTRNDWQWYNDNKAQVDRITSRIAVTQFAAAWIITLQRAAELQLDKTAPSDLNGGAGGLYQSLRMMGLVEMRPERPINTFTDSALEAPHNVLLPIGLGTTTLQQSFTRVGEIATVNATLSSATTAVRWQLAGGNATAPSGNATLQGAFAVAPGQRMFYAAEVQMADAALRGQLEVEYFNAAGVKVGSASTSGFTSGVSKTRLTLTANAPADAVFAQLALKVERTNQLGLPTSVGFSISQPMVVPLEPGAATDPATYAPGYRGAPTPNLFADSEFSRGTESARFATIGGSVTVSLPSATGVAAVQVSPGANKKVYLNGGSVVFSAADPNHYLNGAFTVAGGERLSVTMNASATQASGTIVLAIEYFDKNGTSLGFAPTSTLIQSGAPAAVAVADTAPALAAYAVVAVVSSESTGFALSVSKPQFMKVSPRAIGRPEYVPGDVGGGNLYRDSAFLIPAEALLDLNEQARFALGSVSTNAQGVLSFTITDTQIGAAPTTGAWERLQLRGGDAVGIVGKSGTAGAFSVFGGQMVEASVLARSTTPNGQLQLQIRWYNDAGIVIAGRDNLSANAGNSSNLQTLEVSAFAPTNARFASVQIIASTVSGLPSGSFTGEISRPMISMPSSRAGGYQDRDFTTAATSFASLHNGNSTAWIGTSTNRVLTLSRSFAAGTPEWNSTALLKGGAVFGPLGVMNAFAVKPGEYIDASVLAASKTVGASVEVQLRFLKADGHTISTITRTSSAGGANANLEMLSFQDVRTPAEAAFLDIQVRTINMPAGATTAIIELSEPNIATSLYARRAYVQSPPRDATGTGLLSADIPAGHEDILLRVTPGQSPAGPSLSAIRDFNRNGILDPGETTIYEGKDFYPSANYGTPSSWEVGGALTTYRSDTSLTYLRTITNAQVSMNEALDMTAPGWGATNFWITDWHWSAATGAWLGGGNDIYLTGAGRDYLAGGFGDDWLDAGAGADTISGDAGNDVILGRAGNDSLFGDAGNDAIYEGEGGASFNSDTNTWSSFVHIFGGDGDDTMDGGAGNDHVWGENGDDVLIVDPDGDGTWDYYMGGAGRDTLSYERHINGRTLDVVQRADGYWEARTGGAIWHYSDYINDVENIRGSQGNDNFKLWGADNKLEGLAGDDALDGDGGNDTLEGGAGKDVLNGGDGYDRITYRTSKSAVWIDLTGPIVEFLGGDAEGDTASNFEEIEGSKYNDTIIDNSGSRHLFGLEGDDWLAPNEGVAIVDGGAGFDTIDYSKATSSLVMDMNVGGAAGYAGAGHILQSVEGIVGTDFGDFITGNASDNVITGGKGIDTLNGGAGADTYVIGRDDGLDQISDSNLGSNGLVFGEDVFWGDLSIATPNASLQVVVRGASGGADVAANFGTPGNARVKSIDLSGSGALDITGVTWALNGSDAGETLIGKSSQADLIFAHAGNDTIRGAASGVIESSGNMIVGSFGDDQIFTSTGDDQFAYERGHGVDAITDAGGRDAIVFGPSVTAEDVIYKVIGNDLWIGIRDLANPALEAHQVADRILIVNGGTQYVNDITGATWFNTIEHIVAGGASIEITKLDIPWTTQVVYSGNPYAPLVFDLAGDGLDLMSVNSSSVIFKADNVEGGASLYRIGWVSASDGILALDRNKDGVIDRMNEISFVGDLKGAKTDLEGLVAFDSNRDGVLDAKDAMFGEFRIWRDVNQNGVGGGKELTTLAEIGITSIDLKPMPTGFEYEGNESVAVNTAAFKWADGRVGTAHDVLLAVKEAGLDADTRYAKKRTDFVAPSADGEFGSLQNVRFGPETVLKGTQGAQNFKKSDAGQDGQDAPDPIMRRTVNLHDIAIADEKARRGEAKTMPDIRVLAVGLDGAALKKRSVTETTALRDLDGDGIAEKVSWVGPGAGILVRDLNKDGVIDPLSEFVLGENAAKTDKLNGLAALDSNADGVIDDKDRDFASLQIWRDADGDAISRKSELSSLSAAGIAAIELKANGNGNRPEQSNAPVTVRMASGAKLSLESYDLTARSLIEFARDEANKPDQMRDKPTKDRIKTNQPTGAPLPAVAAASVALGDSALGFAGSTDTPTSSQADTSGAPAVNPSSARANIVFGASGETGAPNESAAGLAEPMNRDRLAGPNEWWSQPFGQQTPTAADWLNSASPGSLDTLGGSVPAHVSPDENGTISSDRSRFIQALAAFGADPGADAGQSGGRGIDQDETIGLPSAWMRGGGQFQRVDG
jgi:Ca2+-binding RTX toxin-like protein